MQSQTKNESAKTSLLFWVIVLAFILLKLWLTGAQKLCALPHNRHDDQLFIQLADSIIQGQWLGVYNNLTLAKGAFYPIWIAISFWLSTPLVLSQHLFYAAACLLAVKAIRPLFRSPLILLPIFVVMLFNPISFSIGEMYRITREGIYPALTLLVFASAIGLAIRYQSRFRDVWSWSIGLGLSLAAFWLTREEGIWILPEIIVLAGISFFKIKPRNFREFLPYGLVWSSALIIPAAAVLLISSLNASYYGVFAKTEFDSKAFLRAYGAMTRVKSDTWLPHVPVSRQARRRIYRVSPAFTELRPYLEGDIGGQFDHFGFKLDQYQNEIQGGWYMWAFRDAVAAAGYYSTGKFPEEYYQRLAAEINDACSKGRLDCYPERASLMPPWHNGYLKPFMNIMNEGSLFLLRFEKAYLIWGRKSIGTEEETRLYRDITREDLCRENEETVIKGWTSVDQPLEKITMQGYFWESVPFIFEVQNEHAERQTTPPSGGSVQVEQGVDFEIRLSCPIYCYLVLDPKGDAPLRFEIKPGMEAQWAEVPGTKVFIESVSQTPIYPQQSRIDQIKLAGLGNIIKVYQILTPYLFILAMIAFLYLGISGIRNKALDPAFWISATILIGVIVRLVLMALVEVTSFSAITTLYLSPVYPLLVWLIFLLISAALIQLLKPAHHDPGSNFPIDLKGHSDGPSGM